MAETRYSKDHEWVAVEGDVATVGITAYAAEQLGDVVFVELPETGRKVKKGDPAAVVESVKAASDVFSPVSGEIVETNSALTDNPQQVNEGAETSGWFMKIRIAAKGELDGLMDEKSYRDFVATL